MTVTVGIGKSCFVLPHLTVGVKKFTFISLEQTSILRANNVSWSRHPSFWDVNIHCHSIGNIIYCSLDRVLRNQKAKHSIQLSRLNQSLFRNDHILHISFAGPFSFKTARFTIIRRSEKIIYLFILSKKNPTVIELLNNGFSMTVFQIIEIQLFLDNRRIQALDANDKSTRFCKSFSTFS